MDCLISLPCWHSGFHSRVPPTPPPTPEPLEEVIVFAGVAICSLTSLQLVLPIVRIRETGRVILVKARMEVCLLKSIERRMYITRVEEFEWRKFKDLNGAKEALQKLPRVWFEAMSEDELDELSEDEWDEWDELDELSEDELDELSEDEWDEWDELDELSEDELDELVVSGGNSTKPLKIHRWHEWTLSMPVEELEKPAFHDESADEEEPAKYDS